MFKVILPIILITTTIITYISIDYFKNKKDNNNSSTPGNSDDINQLKQEESIIEDENLSHGITSQGDNSLAVTAEKNTIAKDKEQVIDVEKQCANEFVLVSTSLNVQDIIKNEEIKVEEQFTILTNKEEGSHISGTSADIDIANTVKYENFACESSTLGKEKEEFKLDQFDCLSFDQSGLMHKEDTNTKDKEEHLQIRSPAQEKESELIFVQEEEQINGSAVKEEEFNVDAMIDKLYESRSKEIEIEMKREKENEIKGSIIIELMESQNNNDNCSANEQNGTKSIVISFKNNNTSTTTTTTATSSTTSSATIINQQSQPVNNGHTKCNVLEVKKDLIKYNFMVQCGGKQQQQQFNYEDEHLDNIPFEIRYEILVSGYPNNVNEMKLSRFFSGCKYEKFIFGPDVSYIKLSNSNNLKRAISFGGNEISEGYPITIINYEGGLGINQSSIVCNYFENNSCKFKFNCNNLHGEPLQTRDGFIPQVYQKCLHSNHIKWWRTMPLLNLEEFDGKKFKHCKKCHNEDQYQNSRYHKYNNTTKFNNYNKKSGY